MIHVADTKVARRYGEYFIRHIQKLMEVKKIYLKNLFKFFCGNLFDL